MDLPCPYEVFVGTQYSKGTISCPPSCSMAKEKNPDFLKSVFSDSSQMAVNQKHV